MSEFPGSIFDQSSIRACRVCGCTDDDACVDPITGETCHWVEDDLCSACVPLIRRPRRGELPMHLAIAALGTVSAHVLVVFAMGVLP